MSLRGTDQIVEKGALFYYLDKAFLVDENQPAKERNGAAPRNYAYNPPNQIKLIQEIEKVGNIKLLGLAT